MTAPLSFPSINPGPVIQDQGTGGAIASALAQVLAAQQHQQEQQWRQQQLEHQWANEAANLQVSQGNLAVNQQQLSAQTTAAVAKTASEGQVGSAMQAALGVGQPQAVPGQVPGQPTLAPPTPPPSPFQQVISGGAQAAKGAPNIFAGVAPENMPAAVEGVQKVRELGKPLGPAPTSDMQNFDRLMQMTGGNPNDPRSAALFWQMIGPKPGNSVTVNNNGEKAFDKSWNDRQAAVLSDAQDVANKSARASQGLAEAYNTVGKSYTGAGANQKLTLARAAIALGVAPETVRAAAEDTQKLLKLSGDQVLALMSTRVLGSNNAISDSDLRFANQQSGRDITQEPTTLKKTYRINMGTGMMLQQDAVDGLREQSQYADPAMSKQLLGRATTLEGRLGGQWTKYAGMLQDEGEGLVQVLDRMPARIRETYGPQIRKAYEQRQNSLATDASKIKGVVLPGQP